MRKDAEQNRDRLVEAAGELMRSEGGAFPLDLIPQRVGLTRATLYRHFPHRQAVYEAVLERDLIELAKRLQDDSTGDELAFVRLTAELMSVYDKFLTHLSEMEDYDFAKNEQRMREVLEAPLHRAKAAGKLRPDLTPQDVLTVCRMLMANWRLDGAPDFASAFNRRLAIMLPGLTPRTRDGA